MSETETALDVARAIVEGRPAPPTDAEIEAVEARAIAAPELVVCSTGEDTASQQQITWVSSISGGSIVPITHPITQSLASFIANARTDVHTIVAAVRERDATIARLTAERDAAVSARRIGHVAHAQTMNDASDILCSRNGTIRELRAENARLTAAVAARDAAVLEYLAAEAEAETYDVDDADFGLCAFTSSDLSSGAVRLAAARNALDSLLREK